MMYSHSIVLNAMAELNMIDKPVLFIISKYYFIMQTSLVFSLINLRAIKLLRSLFIRSGGKIFNL